MTEAQANTYTDQATNLYHRHPHFDAIWVADAEQRLDFLPAYFTRQFMAFERAIFNMADQTIEGPHGYWEYALSNDGLPFVYPAYRSEGNDHEHRMTVSSAFQDNTQDLHPILAGIHTTMLAVLAMMHNVEKLGLDDDEEELIHDRYHQLRDFGFTIAETLGDEQSRAFFRLTD